jgi:hypothetical protein
MRKEATIIRREPPRRNYHDATMKLGSFFNCWRMNDNNIFFLCFDCLLLGVLECFASMP